MKFWVIVNYSRKSKGFRVFEDQSCIFSPSTDQLEYKPGLGFKFSGQNFQL